MLEGDRWSGEGESQDVKSINHTFHLGNKKDLGALVGGALGDLVTAKPERKTK